MEKLILILAGFIVGYLLKNRKSLLGLFRFLVFTALLPYVIIAEISSFDLGAEWYIFIWGSLFIFALFYLGRALGFDKHKSALLATAEGGTLGFILYVFIDQEPISRFFLVDQIGNGAVLFSFIYYILMKEYRLKTFIFNPLIVGMFFGIVFNLIGFAVLAIPFLLNLEPYLTTLLTVLIAVVVGSELKPKLSGNILRSSFFFKFWIIRITGLAVSLFFAWPLAVVILFAMPPSFLLPIVYNTKETKKEREYASNFIAASLAVSLLLSIILVFYYLK